MTLKVGDTVRITSTKPLDEGDYPNPHWTPAMNNCLGKIGTICTIAEGNYGVEAEGSSSIWYYAPHWLTKINTNKSETNKQLLLI